MLSEKELDQKRTSITEKLEKLHKDGFTQFDDFLNNQLNYLDTIEAQEKEIQQLKAQNAAMREALEKVIKIHKTESPYSAISVARQYCERVLSNIEPIEYHNPDDVEEIRVLREQLPEGDVVEVLKEARESLRKAREEQFDYNISHHLEQALGLINKVIGGGQ